MRRCKDVRITSMLVLFILGLPLLAGTPAGAEAPAAPFIAPITFEGRTGCGPERDAARITLTLRANEGYVLRINLKGRELFEGMGLWKVDQPAHRLVLDSGSDRPTVFQLVGAASLKRLYDSKDYPSPSCFETLTQRAHIVEFSGRMRNVTLTSDLWTLETLDGHPVMSADAKLPAIVFDRESNRITGSTGCNAFAGTYMQRGAQTTPGGTISKLMIFPETTRVACALRLRQTAARLRRILSQTAAAHICCSTLELFDKRGDELASFRTSR